MKRLFITAALLGIAVLPRIASADAAQDVTDIRAGRLPVRYDWLGWDGSTAHFRKLVCSEGGTTSCTARIVKQSDVKTTVVELLSINEVYCSPKSPCAALPPATAAAFAARERAANAALPTLTPGTRIADPSHVFGAVASEATTVVVRVRDVSQPDDTPKLMVELVLKGKGGTTETLGTLDSAVYRLNKSAIQGAHLSADGKTVAFAVETDIGVMCWDFSGLATVVVDLSRKKASLANTIGWKTYQRGDMVAALTSFTEATTLDASFGLGWYNRASIESRNLDLASARTSFDVARKLDASFAKRACKDPDFKPLRTSDPSLFSC
jgi:hypothetical protein